MGAVFSSGGAVVSYDDGVQAAASGTTGTQRNEFQAAIKSVTSSEDVKAVFLYDTKNTDSDGGAWRKKCKGLSWFDEPTLPAGTGANQWNSAIRSARSEFPAMSLIVADVPSTGTVTIYDLDDPAAPMWMVFNANTNAWNTNATFVSLSTITSVYALNGRMYVGGGNGVVEIDFLTEQQTNFRPISSTEIVRHKKSGQIIDRNDTSGQFRVSATPIVNQAVNDVAATVLEGAEIGALGLPIPTVAVATDGGLSVIHGGSGAVYDQTHTVAVDNKSLDVAFLGGRNLLWSTRNVAGAGTYLLYQDGILFANASAEPTKVFYPMTTTSEPGPLWLATTSPYLSTFANTKNDSFAIGNTDGLSIIKHNSGNPDEGMVSYHTSSYATGYMVGDIRGAWLANPSSHLDRSVKGNNLTVTGTITTGFVATDAELKYFDGFSASNYFSRAYDADFDFGTGDFSVMVWFKTTDGSSPQHLVDRSDTTPNQRWAMQITATGVVRMYISDGTSSDATAGTLDSSDGNWHFAVGVKRGTSRLEMYIDGVLVSEDASISATGTLSDGDAALKVGVRATDNSDEFTGSLSLLRISATAPTPQQIKEIYDAEKPLFAANAKCLLASGHTSYSNQVKDLSFDKQTGLLTVTQTALTGGNADEGSQQFRGLERVGYVVDGIANGWTYRSTTLVSSAGGVTAMLGPYGDDGGVLVDLPALDVRAELNEGEDKLPDDGKLHFSGVTTDATPTVIGFIPVAENETVDVIAKVVGQKYNTPTSTKYLTCEIHGRFYRGIGGDITARTPLTQKLMLEGDAAYDVDLVTSTGGSDSPASLTAAATKAIMIKVTGWSGGNMTYSAEVEVQRISEKQYER